jgi:3-oxoadipate enol-lactonase
LIIKVNGVDLSVDISGSKVPFIWAHGLMGSMRIENAAGLFNWSECAQITRLVRYDARGHGKSGGSLKPEDYCWKNLGKDMIGVADSLEIDTFIAGGQSMGCATSLCAAAAAPKRVKGLVLVTPPTAWETRAAQASIYDMSADIVEKDGLGVLVDLMQQRPPQPEWLFKAIPQAAQTRKEAMLALNGQVAANVFRGAKLCDLPSRYEIKKLKMPAIILAWTGDPVHPVSTAEELHALMPSSQLFIANKLSDVKTWPRLISQYILRLSA